MKYYSLLKTKEKAKEEFLNMPIIALGLKPSVLEEIEKYKKLNNGKMRQTILTIRDLLEYGKGPLMALLSTTKPHYDVLTENIYHIEERLAKIGLRFSDTEFTIGDVRLSELKLKDDAKGLLKRLGWGTKLKTLDDLIVCDYGKVQSYLKDGESKTLKEIEQSLGMYGLKIEESTYKFNRDESFPLDDYVAYLPKEFLEGRIEIKKKKKNNSNQNRVNVENLSQEEILNLPISNLYNKNSKIATILTDLGIKTIGDLVNFDENKLKKYVQINNVSHIQNRLASYNLSMKNSSVQVVNGVALRKNGRNGYKNGLNLETAPKAVDVQSLNPIAKEKFLNIKLEDFGFSETILTGLKKSGKYKIIGDLLQTEHSVLFKDTSQYVMISLKKIFAMYNLSIKTGRSNKLRDKVFDDKVSNKHISNMSQDEKIKFLDTELKELGFTDIAILELEQVNANVKTIGDLVKYTRKELKELGVRDSMLLSLKRGINHFGLKFKDSRERRSNKTKQFNEQQKPKKNYKWTTKDILESDLKPENRDKLLAKGVEALGLRVRIVEKLKSNGVYTIGELIKLRKMEAVAKVNKNVGQANQIQENLRSIGLDFVPRYTTDEKNNDEKGKEYSEKKISELELLPENRDKLLIKPVEDLGLSLSAVKKLKQSGIETIGDLQKLTATKLRMDVFKGYKTHYKESKQALESVGLELCKGRVKKAKVKEIKVQKPNKTIRNINEEDLSLENREKLLNKPVEDLGIKIITVEKLKNHNINTIGELINLSATEVFQGILNSYPATYKDLVSSLKDVGLFLNQSKQNNRNNHKQKLEELKEKSYEEKLKCDVSDLGLSPVIVQAFENHGIETIGQLVEYSFSDFQKKGIVKNDYAAVISRRLRDCGLQLKKVYKTRDEKSTILQKSKVNFGKDREKAEFVTMDDYSEQLKRKGEEILHINEPRKNINTYFDLSENQVNELNVLRDNLTKKGIWALYELDKYYFASCSNELEAVKEIMREYFDERFNSLIMGAKNEVLLENGIKTLKSASNTFETIIEQKQTELRIERDGLMKKKVETVNGLRTSIFNKIDKYHHNPNLFNNQNKDVKFRDVNISRES